jgi:methyl-accepting chemotaxis protein
MRMTIGRRILAGYGVALLVTGGVGVLVYRSVSELVASAARVTHTQTEKQAIAELRSTLADAETGQRGFLLTGAERYLAPYESAVREIDRDIKGLREQMTGNDTQQRHIAALQSVAAAELADLAGTIALRRQSGQSAAAAAVFAGKGEANPDEARRIMAEMNEEEDKLLEARGQAAKATARFATTAMIAGGLLILVLVSAADIVVQRSITRPLAAFMQFVAQVGAGDLTRQATTSGGDELGKLGEYLNAMVSGLKALAGQTRLAVEDLNAAASGILASTQQQAAGSGGQAEAIQQTSTTIDEVTQSGVQISERARQVVAAAEAASAASHAGLQAVENTTRNMGSIREQAEAVAENVVSMSEKAQAIAEIIVTVNDLAEQLHLLALNAAIEAAAAGEHGRSFSVIASEVKNLADQSREATVQVRAILGDIQKGINSSVMLTEEAVKRVDSGKQQADVADRMIREMADGIQQSVQAFQQIVAGASQQQIGFSQVMQAVREIGNTSQQTSASTRQVGKAALNLTALAQKLQIAVEIYRT